MLQAVVQGVSMVSTCSTVYVLMVLQCVLQSVLECVLQGVLQGVLQRGAVCYKSGVEVFVAGCVAECNAGVCCSVCCRACCGVLDSGKLAHGI